MIADLSAAGIDGSGLFTSDEAAVITEGQVTWVESKLDITITINVLTANGVSVTGTCSGEYVEIRISDVAVPGTDIRIEVE